MFSWGATFKGFGALPDDFKADKTVINGMNLLPSKIYGRSGTLRIIYRIRSFDEAVEEAYRRMFAPQSHEKTGELLEWRFANNPQGSALFVTAEDEETNLLVGLIALIPTDLRVRTSTLRGYQAIDTVVDPAYRGHGVFGGMGRHAQMELPAVGAQVLWGFPNANAAPGWFGRLGWTYYGEVPFLIRPLRTGYFLRRLRPILGSINVPLWTGNSKLSAHHRTIARFEGDTDVLCASFLQDLGCSVVRDAAYLNWRLFGRPKSHYHVIGHHDPGGEVTAFVASCTAAKHGGLIAYIMEAMDRDRDELRLATLIREQVLRAAENGADAVLAWCPKNAPNRGAYRKAGFVPLHPRFRPIEIHFGARVLDSHKAASVCDGSNWYLSYLDSDTI